jgi:glycerophosphoryl diester phosphodiesterase
LTRWERGRPLNWAHRGASGHAPENTLAAFELAAEMEADGVELDVHLSSDDHVVVIHNGSVDATTNGRGRVYDQSLEALQALDAGAWFSPRFNGQRIPTLDQVLAAVGSRLLVNIEIKGEGLRADRAAQGKLEQAVVRLIEGHDLVERVIVSSFYARSLRRVHQLNPAIRLGYLYAGRVHRWLPLWVYGLLTPHDALHPSYPLVGPRYVTRARRLGRPLNVWTVNETQDLRHVRDLGVAGIITNFPDRLARVLAEV